MDLSVALDGTKRRDLHFYPGDDSEIVLTVYQNDGDVDPIIVNDAQLLYGVGPGQGSITPGNSFIPPFCQRQRYTLVAYINGARTTLAYGLLVRDWDDWQTFGDGQYQPLFVRNGIMGGSAGSYFEGPGLDGGNA